MLRLAPVLLLTGCGQPIVLGGLMYVVNISPPHGTVGVSPDIEVSATLSDAVDPDSLSPSAFFLEGDDAVAVSAFLQVVEGDGHTVLLWPDEPLTAGTTYTAVLTSELRGLELGALPGRVEASFVTSGGAPGPVPTANAGADQTGCVAGDLVVLDGSGSQASDGTGLVFSWWLETTPEGSTAELFGGDSDMPELQTDLPGEYIVSLTVSEGGQQSDPDYVLIGCT